MKILFVSQYFYPEIGAGSIRVHEISKYWAERGHHVKVLTGFPNYPTGKIAAGYKKKMVRLVYAEWIESVRVIRTILYPTPYKGSLVRILNYTSYLFSAAIAGLFLDKPDVVVATSPPLLVGLVGLWISTIRRIPFVFDIRDLWPESLVVANQSYHRSIFYKMLDKIAMLLYLNSTKLVVVTEGFKKELLKKRAINAHKIEVVKNGVDPEFFKPFSDNYQIKKQFGLTYKFLISYFGTIGISHGVEEILKVAGMIKKDYPEIHFLIAGEGALREKILQIKDKLHLDNVIIWRNQKREMMPALLNASDVSIVSHVNAKIFNSFIPSKMFESMACERPIIAALKGEAAEIVKNANAGIVVERGNPFEMFEAILTLYQNPKKRLSMGKNGRKYVKHHFTRRVLVEKYESILNELV